jgi:hypothetical protein
MQLDLRQRLRHVSLRFAIMLVNWSGQLPKRLHVAPYEPPDAPMTNVTAGTVGVGEPAQVILTPHGMVVNDEQGAALHANDGSVTLVRTDGSIEETNPATSRIEIADLRTIRAYRINQVFETVSHVVEFEGGGVFACVVDASGKVLETQQRGALIRRRGPDGVMHLEVPPRPPTAQSASKDVHA